MKKFIEKYDGKTIEDWGCTCSKEFKDMTSSFKRALKRTFPAAKLTGFKANHYDFTGFVEQDGKCVYISYSMKRGEPMDMHDSSCFGGVLVRTARDVKDYIGGHNNFCSFYTLKSCVEKVMNSRF